MHCCLVTGRHSLEEVSLQSVLGTSLHSSFSTVSQTWQVSGLWNISSPQPGHKPGQEHHDIVVLSLSRRFVLEPACTLPWELAYIRADDVQVGNLEEMDEVYEENLEDHTKIETEAELAMKG